MAMNSSAWWHLIRVGMTPHRVSAEAAMAQSRWVSVLGGPNVWSIIDAGERSGSMKMGF